MRKPSLFKSLAFLFIAALPLSVFSQPANNACANAITVNVDSACVTNQSSFAGTILNATADNYTIGNLGACVAIAAGPDVWYKFVARTTNPTITISSIGSSFNTTNKLVVQLLSGTCGATSFNNIACTSGISGNTLTITPALTSLLTPGTTYYVRVSKLTSGSVSTGTWTFNICITDPLTRGSRLGEVFARTVLSDANVLNYPWEVAYGPDGNLWVTEAQGYRLNKINPTTGAKSVVLDLSSGSTWLTTNGAPAGSDSLAAIATNTWNGPWPNGTASNPNWPQGGFAGMALHPQFLDGTGTHDFVYVTYVHRYVGGGGTYAGVVFRNKLVRFTYNSGTGKFSMPVVLCDTLPGSSDHNSQRLFVAPVGGVNYLFMAQGDMGAGQFGNRDRPNKAQNSASYEGKILRFNLESDGDAGGNAWIPNDNPFGANSAVYVTGIRNNQGFAYDPVTDILYGSSHGPYSDDEINIIQAGKNYGHPLVIGYSSDGNYNGTTTQPSNTSVTAGAPFTDNSGISACPPIGNEGTNAAALGSSYKDPLFSAYASTNAVIKNAWKNNTGNANWESEAWSGLDLYTNTIIPGWKRSLIAAGLKWGRLIKLNLNAAGTATLPSNVGGTTGNTGDTVTYFQSTNRYRDLAFGPNGKDIYLVIDNSSATSGPGVGNPTTPACPGCLIKYTFLGYADNSGVSTIPTSINVTNGATNVVCNSGTTVTIDATNNNLWVPITGPDGNILAEINANGNNLGIVTSSFYQNSGAIRVKSGVHYLDRNITITPQFQPTLPAGSPLVKIRLYMSKAEYDALDLDPLSGLSAISDLKILKNSDACGSAIASTTTLITPTTAAAHGANGYVLQGNISSFSSFYFATSNVTLPLTIIDFTGNLQQNNTVLLKWKTTNEINSSHFEVERSIDGSRFTSIGTVQATGDISNTTNYSLVDANAINQNSNVIYYRLKIVDKNGLYTYSKIVVVRLNGFVTKVNVMPNPVSSEAIVTIEAASYGKVSLNLYDNSGRLILNKLVQVQQGAGNVFKIDMSKMARGIYILDATGNGIDEKIKIQKF